MPCLGYKWINVVEHGYVREDVDQRGRTWLYKVRCALRWQNMVNLGKTWVTRVKHT